MADNENQVEPLSKALRAILKTKKVDHYNTGGIEVIDFIRAKMTPEEFRGFCKGNIIKYVSREAHKGGDQDLRKARVYIDYLLDETS